MNGSSHYAEAERLLELAAEYPARVITGIGEPTADDLIALKSEAAPLMVLPAGATYTDNLILTAQVHATLALAAVTRISVNR